MRENLHVCHWCGRDFPENRQSCVHCGTPKRSYEDLEAELETVIIGRFGSIRLRLNDGHDEKTYRNAVAVIAGEWDKIQRESRFWRDKPLPTLENILYKEGAITFDVTEWAYEELCARVADQVHNIVTIEYEGARPKWHSRFDDDTKDAKE